MSDMVVDADAFGRTIEQLLGRLETNLETFLPETVERTLAVGEQAWRDNANGQFSGTYVIGGFGDPKYGKVVTIGKYAKSIRHRMMKRGGHEFEGEIGSPSLPGLPHLLEKGHARVGGGYVAGRKHIEPAADSAFDRFEEFLDEAIEGAIFSV